MRDAGVEYLLMASSSRVTPFRPKLVAAPVVSAMLQLESYNWASVDSVIS